MEYRELKQIFRELKRTSPKDDLTAHIIFTEDSFAKSYSLLSRTYRFDSDSKAFWPNMGGYSIFADCLDKASDQGVRLDWYMEEEQLESELRARHVPIGYYFSETGSVNFPDGSLGFVRGDAFYPGDFAYPYLVAPGIGDIELCGDGSTSAQYILMVLRTLPPQALLTIAYDALTSVRSLVIGCGVGLQTVLYITGKNGRGKSQLAKRTVLFYRSKKTRMPIGIVEADSTNAATDHMLHTLRDIPVVVEDLCLSTGRETERKRREQGARLVRKGTSEVPTVKKSGNKTIESYCNAGIVLTAEVTMETESDLNRCLIVPITDYLDLPDGLTPQLISDAIRLFSTWFANNGETELNRLKQELANGDWGRNQEHRVRTNYLCLRWAFQSLLTALDPNNLFPGDNCALSRQMEKALAISLNAHTKMREKLQDDVPRGNLAFIIYQGSIAGCFNLAKNPENLDKHGGVVWRDDLCLRPDELIHYVRTQPGYHKWSRNRITQELKDIGALVLQEDGAATVHIKKKLPRVYRIRLDVLEDMAEQF